MYLDRRLKVKFHTFFLLAQTLWPSLDTFFYLFPNMEDTTERQCFAFIEYACAQRDTSLLRGSFQSFLDFLSFLNLTFPFFSFSNALPRGIDTIG